MVNWCYLLKFYLWSMGPLISLIHITSHNNLYIYSSLPVSLVMFLKWNILHHMFPLSPAIIHWTHYIYSNVMRALPSPFLSIWPFILSYFVLRMEMEDLEWSFLLFQLSESNQSFSLEEKVEKREIHQLQGEGGAEVDGVQYTFHQAKSNHSQEQDVNKKKTREMIARRGLKRKNVNKGSMDITRNLLQPGQWRTIFPIVLMKPK